MKTKITTPQFTFGAIHRGSWARTLPGTRWLVRRLLVVAFSIAFLGGSAIPAYMARDYYFALAAGGHSWNLVGWEANALSQKLKALFQDPADSVAPAQTEDIVKQYLTRALRIGEIEDEFARRSVLDTDVDETPSNEQLLAELATLREQQGAARPEVEQLIERQVSSEFAHDGFTWLGTRVWPPVSFTFVEPPKKMIVSRRDRIETIYSEMLEAGISLAEIQDAEAKIGQQENAVGYITDIGGLGAYPTMVVDRASLRWILSTVAHEWTHNYLTFHALGWNYFKSQDLTTMNETVAEIVGNEIGDQTLARYYPDLVPPPQPDELLNPAIPAEPAAFDFNNEMQRTRLEVDRLLAQGDVEGAEQYMEQRRQDFVQHGYPLRVLNQAYFAFHGSYGTSPASTSPIGPDLARLRQLTPDLKTFLETVSRFSSTDDLDKALAEWEAKAGDIPAGS